MLDYQLSQYDATIGQQVEIMEESPSIERISNKPLSAIVLDGAYYRKVFPDSPHFVPYAFH